jgi:hypothetical protein
MLTRHLAIRRSSNTLAALRYIMISCCVRTVCLGRVVQFGVRSKVRVRKLSRILTNPKNAVCELLKVCQTLSPFFELLGPKLQPNMQKKSPSWPSNVLFFCALIVIFIFIQDNRSMFLSSSEHGNQQNPPLLKSHIELLKQFKGSRTFTNFIEPLLPKKRTEQPCA